jgi:Tol biopolymer transport system component/DNA-binding winged helix-turn-helix (wHTH) protein
LAQIYRFDDVEIDLGNFQVLKAGRVLPIEPKALNLLVFLVENRGRLIEKRELIDGVWGDAYVTENVLTRAVGQLRKALEDDAKDARYIETVPTRGYRFIATLQAGPNGEGLTPVSAQSGSASSVPQEAMKPHLRRYGMAVLLIVFVAGAMAVLFLVSRFRPNPPPFQIASSTQLTTSGGLTFFPTFSPDASEIAYCTDRGKGFEIFRRQLAPGGKEFQLTSDGEQNIEPAWSPDGSLIAYYSNHRGGIWLLPALGGQPRRLTEFGSHPAWSRDGQWIAFQSSPLNDFGADAMGAFPPSTIWAIHPDGSGARQITLAGKPRGGHGAPSWSPDSRHITFVSASPAAVWSIALDGSGLARLSEIGFFYDPVYSPDGTSVLYGADTPSGNMEPTLGLFRVRVSPDTSIPLGQPERVMDSNGFSIKNLAFSADGKKLVYAALGMTSSLHSIPLSKLAEAAGEPVELTSSVGCRNASPSFSPDGNHIALVSCLGRPGLASQIWMMNPDGSNLHQLTNGLEEKSTPTWYPDSRRILFSSLAKDGAKYVSVDAGTLEQKIIRENPRGSTRIDLSPDGARLAMSIQTNGVVNVWAMDLASGNLKQLTFEKENAGFPKWSPDGKFIAVELDRGADNSIGILPSGGGPIIALTPYVGRRWLNGWSSDGDKIFYAKQTEDLIWNIWSVSRSSGIEKQLSRYTKTNEYVRYPAASPRGDQVVYEYTETTGNIWMLQFK